MRVAILSPVDTSPFTRLVAKFCQDEPGIELAGIVIRKILNPGRLRSELKRDGVRLVRKAWKKLALGGDVRDSSAGERGFFELTVERGLEGITASAYAAEHGVSVVKVVDHNDAESIEFLQRVRPTSSPSPEAGSSASRCSRRRDGESSTPTWGSCRPTAATTSWSGPSSRIGSTTSDSV